MTSPPAPRSVSVTIATILLVSMALAAGCSSGPKAGPPTLPSGINRVVITVHSMSGDSPTKTLTDPVAIATLRESVNRLPRIGKGARRCVTDRGTWTLTFTGRGPRTTMTFDATGCNEVQVRIGGEPAATRQGNDALRTQLTDLIS
jgi:hypothetical protein